MRKLAQLSLPVIALLAALAVFLLRTRADESMEIPGEEAADLGGDSVPGNAEPQGKGYSARKKTRRQQETGRRKQSAANQGGSEAQEETEFGEGMHYVFRGRLLNCDTEDPVEGVAVEAWGILKDDWFAKSEKDFLGRAVTGPDGRFNLELPLDEANLLLLLSSRTTGTFIEEASFNEEEQLFYVYSPFAAEGFVSDPQGLPVAGAMVLAFEEVLNIWEVPPDVAANPVGVPWSMTDSRGFYRIETLSSSRNYRMFAVDSEGFTGRADGEVRFEGEDSDPVKCDIRIEGRGTLNVILRGFEAGGGSAEIRLCMEVADEEGRRSFDDAGETRSDETGKACFRNLKQGAYKITAWPDGYLPFERVVQVFDRGVANVDVKLERGKELTGVVVDRNGRPVSEASLRVCLACAVYPLSWLSRFVQAGTDGTFRLEGVPARGLEIHAGAEGFVDMRFDYQMPGDVKLVLAACPVLQGNIRDSFKGRLPARFDFRFFGQGFMMLSSADADSDGSFSIWVPFQYMNATPETVFEEKRCRCVASTGMPANRVFLDLGEYVLKPDVVLTARPAISIGVKNLKGRVSDRAGNPVSKAKLHIRADGGAYLGMSDSSEDGSFFFECVPRIDAKLTAEHHSYPMLETEIPAESEPVLDIVFRKGASVKGAVLDGSGEAITEFWADISSIDKVSGRSRSQGILSYSTGSGFFEFHRLNPGCYRIVVNTKKDKRQIEIELAEGERKIVEFRFP